MSYQEKFDSNYCRNLKKKCYQANEYYKQNSFTSGKVRLLLPFVMWQTKISFKKVKGGKHSSALSVSAISLQDVSNHVSSQLPVFCHLQQYVTFYDPTLFLWDLFYSLAAQTCQVGYLLLFSCLQCAL